MREHWKVDGTSQVLWAIGNWIKNTTLVCGELDSYFHFHLNDKDTYDHPSMPNGKDFFDIRIKTTSTFHVSNYFVN